MFIYNIWKTKYASGINFVIYMAIQVVIDIFQGYFNTAIVKIIILFIFGAGLNMLCQKGSLLLLDFNIYSFRFDEFNRSYYSLYA